MRRRARARQNVDDAHGTAAAEAAVDVDAHEVAQALAIIGVAADPRRGGLIEQPPDQDKFALPVTVGEEAVVADAMEAVGQAMEQETADELMGVERHHLCLVVLTVIAPQEALRTIAADPAILP